MSTLRVDNIKSRTGTVVTIPDTHTLAVTGIASVSGDINVSGNELITGVSTVSGTQTINGTQIVNGAQTVSGNQTVSGSITYNTGAHFNNPTGIVTTGTLNVVGTTSFGSITGITTQMVVGSATTIHADGIDLGRVGVITAATFSGNASGLSGTPNVTVRDITANNITGVAATFTGNATIGGNLTVNGTQTTVNTATLSIADAQIDLRTGNNITAGNGGVRVVLTTNGSGVVQTSRDIRWNNTSGKWEFTEDGSTYKKIGSGDFALSYFAGSFN